MARPIEHVLRMTGAGLEDVALAIAAEFVAVDPVAEHEHLDLLAQGLGSLESRSADDRAHSLLEWLGTQSGFDVGDIAGPEGLLIDRVLDSRRGHPILLSVIYAAVARRAGYHLCPAGTERFLVLADPKASPPVAIDPVPGGRPTPRSMRWLCPHLVGAMICGGLARSFVERGEITDAIRAAELRLLLPFRRPLRDRFKRELTSLRATLN